MRREQFGSSSLLQLVRWIAALAVLFLVQREAVFLQSSHAVGESVRLDDPRSLSNPTSHWNWKDSQAIAASSHNDDGSAMIMDPVTEFHIPAYNRIRELVTNTTIISWGFKKQKGFPDELRIKAGLSLPITRMHGRKLEDKLHILLIHNGQTALPENTTESSLPVIEDAPLYWEAQICDFVQLVEEAERRGQQIPPHVLFTRCNENFGDFSQPVPDHKTASWNVNWEDNGCVSAEAVFRYLNKSTTRAVFTTQHHFLDHPKVHSLPLGIKHTMKVPVLRALREPRVNKTKLLMINDNGWKHRKTITKIVLENFAANGTDMALKNTYSNKKSKHYLAELKQSKFIMAPSGLGWDCYRIWEALHFNTIPIVERYYRPHDGWRRTLSDLPVLWVEDFRNLTPSLLRVEYERIASRGSDYSYEKLTTDWWADFVLSKLNTTLTEI